MKIFLIFTLITAAVAFFPERHPNNDKIHRGRSDSSANDMIHTDVLIIGAGISGLEIARRLNQHQVKTIVLEARDRLGGRIWSKTMKNNHIFDMGAAWIHGIHGSIPGGYWSNPLWDLTQEARVATRPTELDDLRVFPSSFKYMTNIEEWYEDFIEFVRTQDREGEVNETLRYYADAFVKQEELSPEERDAFFSFLHLAVENQEGAELELIGAKDVFDVTSNHYGAEHVFHDTGFKAVIDYLATGLPDVRLQRVVTEIHYDSSMVHVRTRNNETYHAKYAVVTVPLGILKGRTIKFDPPLPSWKMNAIDRIGFGLLDKAVFLWENAWWNETEYFFFRPSSDPSKFNFWVNANKWNDRPALFCYFVGKEAIRLEYMNESQMRAEMQQALQGMFPDRTVPPPIDSFLTTWKRDEFSNGSYSYMSVNQRPQDPARLAEPLQHRLLFAGEATNVDTYGFAHGALTSARREATRLLYDYDLASDSPAPAPAPVPHSAATIVTHWSLLLLGFTLYLPWIV